MTCHSATRAWPRSCTRPPRSKQGQGFRHRIGEPSRVLGPAGTGRGGTGLGPATARRIRGGTIAIARVQGGRQLGQAAIGQRITVLRISKGIPAVVDPDSAGTGAPTGGAGHALATEHGRRKPTGLRGAKTVAQDRGKPSPRLWWQVGIAKCGQQQEQSGVGVGGGSAGQSVVGRVRQLGPGEARPSPVPGVTGQGLGLLPRGVVGHIFHARIFGGVLVDHVQAHPTERRHREHRSVVRTPQAAAELPDGGEMVPPEPGSRCIAQTATQMSPPEQLLLKQLRTVGVRPRLADEETDRMQIRMRQHRVMIVDRADISSSPSPPAPRRGRRGGLPRRIVKGAARGQVSVRRRRQAEGETVRPFWEVPCAV